MCFLTFRTAERCGHMLETGRIHFCPMVAENMEDCPNYEVRAYGVCKEQQLCTECMAMLKASPGAGVHTDFLSSSNKKSSGGGHRSISSSMPESRHRFSIPKLRSLFIRSNGRRRLSSWSEYRRLVAVQDEEEFEQLLDIRHLEAQMNRREHEQQAIADRRARGFRARSVGERRQQLETVFDGSESDAFGVPLESGIVRWWWRSSIAGE